MDYTTHYHSPVDPVPIRISNRLRIETFDGQKNIVKMQIFPSGKSLTYYFDSDETRIEVKF